MKMVKTICACDICKEEVKEEDLIATKLPFETSKNTTSSVVSWSYSGKYDSMDVEVCPDCARNISNKIKEYVEIGDFPYVGKEIKLVQPKTSKIAKCFLSMRVVCELPYTANVKDIDEQTVLDFLPDYIKKNLKVSDIKSFDAIEEDDILNCEIIEKK